MRGKCSIHLHLKNCPAVRFIIHKLVSGPSSKAMNAETLKQVPPEERCFYLLGLKPGATREEVREAYRRLNLRYHPDRPHGGDANKFLLISKAYVQAITVIEKGQLDNTSARGHEELRASAKKALDPATEEKRVLRTLDPKNFNVNAFNEAFEQFHIQEPWMRGGYQCESGGPREETVDVTVHPELLHQRTPDAFKQAFEQEMKQKGGTLPRDLMLYHDPMPISRMGTAPLGAGGGGGLQPALLGDCPEDFTEDGRFTDYMKAHTVYNTCTAGLDVDNIPVRTLEGYKAARETIDPLTEEERRYMDDREQAKKEAEERRLARLREYDQQSEKRYLDSHQIMLGHAPTRS